MHFLLKIIILLRIQICLGAFISKFINWGGTEPLLCFVYFLEIFCFRNYFFFPYKWIIDLKKENKCFILQCCLLLFFQSKKEMQEILLQSIEDAQHWAGLHLMSLHVHVACTAKELRWVHPLVLEAPYAFCYAFSRFQTPWSFQNKQRNRTKTKIKQTTQPKPK